MVEDLVRLMDHLKIEKAHVVGYSMGGFITLKMIAMHPGRILSAAACGAGWEQATPENAAFAEAVAKAVEKGEPGPLPKRLGVVDRPLTLWEKLAVRISLAHFNDPLALSAVARGSQQLTLTEEELRSNKVPTLTIIGSEDGLLSDARALSERMANHELVVIEGKNHMNTDVSGAFLKSLKAFLAKHTLRALETESKK
jgi:pimeloyl-ACP methyl ester carboxylesterase